MDKAKDEAINKLIAGQEKMGKEIAEIKVDIADLKQGQNALESMMLKMMEEMTFNAFKPACLNLPGEIVLCYNIPAGYFIRRA